LDKYEYKLKMDEIKSLASEKRYEEAAVIVDSINWRKVRNVNSLVKAGEIYAQVGRYEEAKEILLMAYDRSPIGRMIIYRLAEVAIKQKNFEEAQEYYDEFVEIAPHDNLKYVLRYEINRAKDAGIDVLIGILEELKDQEYTERWAFELAFLYHKAGRSEQCIDACDELILWFGDGPYVEKALELKMLYQPLNKAQEDKYRKFKQHRDGIVEVRPTDTLESGEIIRETVQIPQVTTNASKFNTVNLQQELAKSMQQIMEATEKETVSDTMDNIKKIVEEIPYLQIPQEEGAEEQLEEKYGHIETDEEIDGSLRTNFQELLGEEYDGQLSLVMPERALLEKQITGQMNIQDVLEEWERTRRAAEAALQEAEQRKLESAKAKALAQAEDIMDRLATVIPQLDAGMTPKDLLEQEYLGKAAAMDSAEIAGMMTKHRPKEEAGQLMADVNSILQQQIDELSRVNEGIDEFLSEGILPENLAEGFTNDAEVSEGFEDEVAAPEDIGENYTDEIPTPEDIGADYTDEIPMPEDFGEGIPVEQWAQENFEGAFTEELQEKLPEEDFLPEMTAALEAEVAAMTDEDEWSHEAEESDMEAEEFPLPKIQLEPEAMEAPGGDTKELPKISELEFEDEPEEDMPITRLSERQREIFTYFTPVTGMEQQLCQVLTGAKKHLKDAKSCKAGNIIIQGVRGSGKTVLATSIIKALQEEIGRPSSKVGKIDAISLNQKDIPQLLKKIQGGCLIIEKVGDISRETAVKLSLALEADSSGILVIIEDTRTGINKAMGRDESLARKFTEKINLPIFTSDELVSFARAYAKELMFEIDDMAMLALYNRISNIQKADQATTLTEVKEIVDEAIANAEKFSMKKAFGLLASRKSKDSDYEILHEKDFEE
jgi:tetratricopeptide (TPR) repeat protein/Cdc6-like AAA superfamily ATPase